MSDFTALPQGHLNRLVGWISIALGVGLGLLLGLWSFDGPISVPQWIGGYADTPRRLLRLGHIAFFGLGMLNILIARELPHLKLSQAKIFVTGGCMIAGNLFLPPLLLASSLFLPLKFLLPLPALCVFVGLVLNAYGLCNRRRNPL